MAQSDFMDRIASDETQKSALLFAFYNSVVFTLLGLCLIGIFAIYQVLFMFLMPILWAILVGTVLFPFKRHLSATLKGWFGRLDDEDRPLLIGVAFLPLEFVRKSSDYVYNTALSSTGVYCAIGYMVLKILCFEDIFLRLLSWLGVLYSALDYSIEFTTQRLIFAALVLYTAAFVAWITLQDAKRIHKKFARTLSLPIWLLVLAHVAEFFGPLRVFIFTSTIIVLSLIALGVIGQGKEYEDSSLDESLDDNVSRTELEIEKEKKFSVQTPTNQFASAINRKVDEEIRRGDTDAHGVPSTFPSERAASAIGREVEEDVERLDHALSGDAHLRIIGGLCLLLWTVHYDVLLIFILIPFLIAAFIRIGERIGVFDVLIHLADVMWLNVRESVSKLVNVLVAGSLRKFVKLLFTSDKMFVTSLASRVDFISSVVVMASIAMGSLFFLFFTIFQIHNETVHLVKLGSNLIQSNPDWMKYAVNYTEGQLAEHDIGEYVEQGYQQARKWMASNVRSLADPADPDRADQLEDQVKLLVDSIYQMWTERNSELNATTKAVYSASSRSSPSEWMMQIMSTSNIQSLKGEIANVISENIETVLAIMHSLWTVIIMNFSLLQTMIGAVLSLIFGFGFELLNLLIELIVFLTAVYYLLASSDSQWLPLRLVSELAPTTSANGNSNLNIAEAFEDAISGVFVLSAKMSIFYGFYTYFVHSLFELNIVFVPSILAAIFAAIPIMPPYIVGVIGFVEIFLVRGDTVAGVVFGLASIAPLFFADVAFYKEVKGSHPYVTGLAVIGGMYWLGLQGAIFGPIILCCVIALFNLYKEFAKSR